MLKTRYEHRRILVQDHAFALRNLSPLREESAPGLQGMLDSLERHRDQLRALGRPVNEWDDWFVSCAATAMDPLTRRGWEDDLENLEAAGEDLYVATFSSLTTFLRKRCRTLTSLEGSHPLRDSTSRSSVSSGYS